MRLAVFGSLLWLLVGQLQADPVYPVHISGPPGIALHDHMAFSDDAGGVVAVFNDRLHNTAWLYWLNVNGEPVWSASDSVISDVNYPRTAVDAKSSSAGFLVLFEGDPAPPPTPNWLEMVCFSTDGEVLWSSLVCDTLPGGRARSSLTVVDSIATVLWLDDRYDANQIYYQRVNVYSGQNLAEPNGSLLGSGLYHDVLAAESDLVISADSCVYHMTATGEIHVRTGQALQQVKTVFFQDTLLVVGIQGSVLLLECFDEQGLSWIDTVATGLTLPKELAVAVSEDQLNIFWTRQTNVYRRCFSSNGLSQEEVVCEATGYQRSITAVTASASGAIFWHDTRTGSEVYFRNFNGSYLSAEHGIGEVDFQLYSACTGIDYPWLTWVQDSCLYFQPADSQWLEVSSDWPREIPREFELGLAYPNPFNSSVNFSVSLPTSGQLRVRIYNALGQQVAILAEGFFTGGSHQFQWAPNTASGMYIIRADFGEHSLTRGACFLK